MISKEIETWKYGKIDNFDPDDIPVGSVEDSLNFLTLGDKIELRRGYTRLGATSVSGPVTGLHVGVKLDTSGTQVPFRTRARKIEYYDSVTDDWIEIGTNSLPAAADGEDIEFASYNSQAGAQVFFSSPNSSIYKIMVANPGSITDLLATTYRGYIRIKQSRMFLWNRKGTGGTRDEQNPYLSYIDGRQYTTVTAEATTSLSGTLAFKGGGSKRTCFGVVITITASGEVYTDNRDGTLTGSLGGTGTINYTTGDYTLSAAGVGTADYQWEDSSNQGLADFTYSSPTRTAGQGTFFLQGDGGPLMGIESYGDIEYCGHKLKTYALSLTSDDTNATNLIFRDNEGIPNHRAMKGTSRGIFYVNAVDETEALLKVMRLQGGSTAVDGEVISTALKLEDYRFDKCWIGEWDTYILFGCRTEDSTVNNRILMYHKDFKSFDIVDLYASCYAIYNGALLLGDSITGNVYTAFSGVDDDNAVISGFAQLNIWDLEYKDYLKKVKKLQLEGDIGPNQVIDVKVSIDRGSFVTVGQIKGSGTYVDRAQRVNVGAFTLGRGEVGGGSSGIEAYHYFREISLRIDRFEDIQIRLETGLDADNANAEGIGYFSMSMLRFKDIRVKSQKAPRKYR